MTRIDSYAFDDNTDLAYVNAPELRTMGRNVFNDSGKLISVNLPKLESMEHGCFGINTTMTIMRLPSLVTITGDGLINVQQLRFLHLPALKTMGGGALNGDGLLQALYIPSLAVMEGGAMPGTDSLKKISLPAADVTLKNTAFQNASIEELTIRGAKKTLQGAPFQDCGSLKTICFGDTAPIQAEDRAFTGSSPALVGHGPQQFDLTPGQRTHQVLVVLRVCRDAKRAAFVRHRALIESRDGGQIAVMHAAQQLDELQLPNGATRRWRECRYAERAAALFDGRSLPPDHAADDRIRVAS